MSSGATAGPSGGGDKGPAKEAKKESTKNKTQEWYTKLRKLYTEHKIPPERLETLQRLGEGGFASVDLCQLKNADGTETQVAVKRVKPGALKMATQLKLFTNESEIMVKLKHHCIAQLIGLGCMDDSTNESMRDTFYLVEELCNGGSLRRIVLHQMIHQPVQLYRISDAVRWSTQLGEALAYMHGLDPVVVHRDLKPDNILLTGEDPYTADVKLVDFGLSVMIPNKHVQAEAHAKAVAERNATKEHRWSKNMGPTSKQGVMGANAILHMIEGPGAENHAGYDALAPPSTTLDHYGGPTSQRLTSRATGGPTSRGLGPTSRGPMSKGPTSAAGKIISSVFGLNSKKGLEAPSAVMFDLTSMTGSLLYMAPEVFKGENYNYKADVFSFGVVMYELLHQRLIMATLVAQQITDRNVFENEIMEFTKSVASGYRPPIDDFLPEYMVKLIQDCWAQNPTQRPPMKTVVEVLKRFAASPELVAIDKAHEAGCCCTVS